MGMASEFVGIISMDGQRVRSLTGYKMGTRRMKMKGFDFIL